SFFTFTQIAFLVDAYRREAKEYSLVNYMLFVTYFPHLLAGPILHHKEMMPQFASKYNWVKNYRNIALGLFIFSIGLFKKVVIADTFAPWATAGFDTATTLNLIEAWATSLSYTFQLYFDFSGYCDMAIGISLMFNIKLPINFNSPYKALNIQDFWRRWHMTLSRFLRDYIYIPLGGNRKGNTRTYVNLLSTFLIGGLWHGAGWTFIIWGALHGIALAIHRFWQSLGFKMNKVLAWFITFNFINITWIFFRAKDFESAMKVLSSMLSLDNVVLPEKYFKFLAEYNEVYFRFGTVYDNILGKDKTTIFIITALFLVLIFKNSME
ncbi:MBOAT family O-acyltransferase, partial [Aliarcobacter cryaerophilus]|uniref:MBOAT family O-acyltransferase n=1 Tax=Aliarcobacter cryaerophilus TaxID=28198 RepID=UPI0021B3DA3D